MQSIIEQKLNQNFELSHLTIENESHMHSGPATDSHFKLTLVSDDFNGKRPVARHQMVYAVLADELAGAIHALAVHPYTSDEWQQRNGQVPQSAPCKGSSVK